MAKTKAKAKEKPPKGRDEILREHVVFLLDGGGAHVPFDDAVADWPKPLRGNRIQGFPHTAWMLLEHMRIAQRDILDFSRNRDYIALKWPEAYWPEGDAPEEAAEWEESVQACRADLDAIKALVENPKTDLYAEIPGSEGKTILREALLVADHNAYHLGQLVALRRILGDWEG